VSESLDGGRTWKRIDDDQIHEALFSKDPLEVDRIHQLAVGIDGTVYAATGDAVFARKLLVRKHTVRR
jgi:photosystem II stability/assembly factor-like uncharacterized protein